MKIQRVCGWLLGLLLLPVPSWAETVVLVHGFQSDGMDWRKQGVTPVLQQYGWVDGGNFLMTQQGPYNALSGVQDGAERVFFTVDLPSRAPVPFQAQLLQVYLQRIYLQRQEPLTLVGHSAGGVVARYALLQSGMVPIQTLVTVASPHLGTPLADVGKLATATPLGDMADEMGFGKWASDAESVYHDLQEEKPVNFLFMLNHQSYPPIRYVSLVRANQPNPDRFDFFVPTYSQNMNNVYGLHQRSEVWPVEGSHFLGVPDGYALAAVLGRH